MTDTSEEPALRGPVLHLPEAAKLGLLKPGSMGWCFGKKFECGHPACSLCLESDRCQLAMMASNDDAIHAARQAQVTKFVPIEVLEDDRMHAQLSLPPAELVTEKPPLQLPQRFSFLDIEILKLKYVARFSYKTIITYSYKYHKLVSIVAPINETLTLIFHRCKIEDFKDPNNCLFYGVPRLPKFPAMFVRENEQEYAADIIKQAHKLLQTKINLFSKK